MLVLRTVDPIPQDADKPQLDLSPRQFGQLPMNQEKVGGGIWKLDIGVFMGYCPWPERSWLLNRGSTITRGWGGVIRPFSLAVMRREKPWQAGPCLE